MNAKTSLKKADVVALFAERTSIENWIDPKPDPSQWPPVGWHEESPGVFVRRISEEELRKEIFGDPEREEWLKPAKSRLAEIDALLTTYFFPKPKEEGIQRKEKSGFITSLKMGLKREIDQAALDSVLEACEEWAQAAGVEIDIEDKLVDHKPVLKLTEYRNLPEGLQKIFDNALVITPDKPKFEIIAETP